MAKVTIMKCDRCRKRVGELHTVKVTRRLDFNGVVTDEDPWKKVEDLCGGCFRPFKEWLERKS